MSGIFLYVELDSHFCLVLVIFSLMTDQSTFAEAIDRRHSVRKFTDRKIEGPEQDELEKCIAECNAAGNLHIRLMRDEPLAFHSKLAHYGTFKNVKNYIVLAGKAAGDLDERIGYYGEKIVLLADMLGLNSCWVGLTYSKGKIPLELAFGEKLVLVIALGYGETKGVPHKSKSFEQIVKGNGPFPDWFRNGVAAALKAPTAMNQQNFKFELVDEDRVRAERGFFLTARGFGAFDKVDLGIAKLHFEIGAGMENFKWVE